MSAYVVLQHFLAAVWDRFLQIVTAPLHNPQMLWITLPLLITLLLMEFYFGRYTKEELGWNTAVANSLVLVFVSLDLLRQIYGVSNPYDLYTTFDIYHEKTIIALAVGVGGLLIMNLDFFHILPKKFAFKISSSLPVNFIAYLSVVAVYTNLTRDWYALAASAFLFLAVAFFFGVVHYLEPEAGESVT